MKSYIYPLTFSLLLSAASCSHEEDNIWPDSAAVRTEKVVKEQREVLCGAVNGWNMYYFAPESENGGVNFTLKFNSDASVVIGSKNIYNTTSYAEETSMWEIITDNGPVLSFNSYNNIFHFFSDPDANGIVGAGTQGVGLGGDYEFIIMDYSADHIILKGKKTGVYCLMEPLQDDEVGEAYFNKLEAMESEMFNSQLPYIWLVANNGERYSAKFKTGSRTVDFVIEGGDPLFDTHTVPYVITNDGVRLFEPFEGDNEDFKVQNFVYDTEYTSLVCIDDNKSYFITEDLDKLFTNTSISWEFAQNDVSGKFAEFYQDVVTGCKTTFSQTFQKFAFKYYSKENTYSLWFRDGSKYPNAYLYCNIETKVNENDKYEVSFSFTGNGDNTGKGHLNRISAFNDLIQYLNDNKFELYTFSTICAQQIKLVSKSNPNDYIIVNVTK